MFIPFTLPDASRHGLEGRVHAVDMVGDITVIAQSEPRIIITLPAALAYSAVQTTPPFRKDHLRHLRTTQYSTIWF